ncbi:MULTISPECIES: hypothetical protein [Halomonadaceae]|uniref:hypothetical protein n=1 Tax=Halomonadaceae TaxID=28256 RepID=UPI0012F2A3A0|nr:MULTISPECIES: hypothetical protein [Halomonas]CAD5264959.1 hypothetical protein HALO156_130910 [Halomonas sp. 156]CAD5266014.1 hypothetical protein HALOI3_190338 [Halomonas sp. I3]CAD5283737.1 hypothetical protein HALO113_80175 [Halomonas sp. 113]CAD5285177.1 hypothetical protein HALO59_50174 [Halomonas sp. 59]VXB25207.1 hypothetical protein HALO153_120098 [Halomonas titanicae]
MGILSSKVYLKKITNNTLSEDWYSVIPEGFDNNSSLPIKVIKSPAPNQEIKYVTFFFHGAVDQKKRALPIFEGRFISKIDIPNCLVLSISDPTLKKDKGLGATWYAGVEGFDLPVVISKFVDEVLSFIKPEKVIFTGGSIGGYPALVHASKVKNAIAILRNPILEIENYFPGHIKRYADLGWGVTVEDLSNVIELDSFRAFEKSVKVNVIYVQNATDHHFWMQAVGFLSKLKLLKEKYKKNFLFISSHYEGYVGHKFPPNEWGKWVKAACLARTSNVVDIADKYDSMSLRDIHKADDMNSQQSDILIQQKISEL